jgi:hypothetical protein
MAIREWQARVKLHDDDLKALGVSRLVAGSVKCAEGLTEGQDFTVDLARGTVRRLRPFGRELYTFTMQYEDGAEEQAAAEAAAAEVEAKAIGARTLWDGYEALRDKTPTEIEALVRARINGWSTLTAAKADLAEWLPRMAALLAWAVRRQ